jgi:hypothetical protein
VIGWHAACAKRQEGDGPLTASAHEAATKHLPAFITAPGQTDHLLVVVVVFLVVAVLIIGNLFLTLHSLPERMAHKGQKLQFEIVAVLCLLSLFTHNHAFWVAGLLLAFIDLPDFAKPLNRIAGSVEKLAGIEPEPVDVTDDAPLHPAKGEHAKAQPAAVHPVEPQPVKPQAVMTPPMPQPGTAAAQKA